MRSTRRQNILNPILIDRSGWILPGEPLPAYREWRWHNWRTTVRPRFATFIHFCVESPFLHLSRARGIIRCLRLASVFSHRVYVASRCLRPRGCLCASRTPRQVTSSVSRTRCPRACPSARTRETVINKVYYASPRVIGDAPISFGDSRERFSITACAVVFLREADRTAPLSTAMYHVSGGMRKQETCRDYFWIYSCLILPHLRIGV